MRIDPHQRWHPVYLLQPLYNLVLAAFFEWGVALHDLDFEAIRTGEKSKREVRRQLKGMAGKARSQIVKDYLAFPALSGRKGFKSTLKANFTANIVRNVWAYAIIFCGHFPDQTYTFSEEEVAERDARRAGTSASCSARRTSRAARSSTSSAATSATRSSTTSSPTCRARATPRSRRRVREICERYELPYNSGPLGRQLGTVQRTILRLAFPGGHPRPKPGPSGELTEQAVHATSRMSAA